MWAAGFAAYLLAATWFVPWHALPLLPLAAVDARDARGRAFLAAVVAFSFTSMFAVVPVRFGVPLAVGLVAAYGAPRLRRAFAPSTA
jgi:hypothetical protein